MVLEEKMNVLERKSKKYDENRHSLTEIEVAGN